MAIRALSSCSATSQLSFLSRVQSGAAGSTDAPRGAPLSFGESQGQGGSGDLINTTV